MNKQNIINLYNEPFYALILAVTKMSPDNEHTMNDLIRSMNTDIEYKLVDATKVILGSDQNNNKIYHVQDKTVPEQVITNFALSTLKYLPITDSEIKWDDIDDFHSNTKVVFPDDFLAQIVTENGTNIANRLGDLVMNGDFTSYYEYIATKGMGAHLLKYNEENRTYEIDLLYMSNYSVRNSYLPYGAKATFDDKFNILSIQVGYVPYYYNHKFLCIDRNQHIIVRYDPNSDVTNEWKFVHNVFTSSLITYVTIKDHLLDTHMLGSDNLLYTYYKYCEKLGRTDTLSQFIEPFVFGTAKINTAATQILFGKNNALNRLFAFDNEGMNKFVNDIVMNHQKIRQIDLFKINGTTQKTPLARDMEKYWNIIYVFVNDFINKISEDQIINFYNVINQSITTIDMDTIATEVCNFLTYNIMVVTIWHQFIGTMSIYTFNPYASRVLVFKNDPCSLMCKKYESYRAMIVTAITSRQKFPKITDVSAGHMCRLQGDWNKFQQMLNDEVFETEILQPEDTECSVSF